MAAQDDIMHRRNRRAVAGVCGMASGNQIGYLSWSLLLCRSPVAALHGGRKPSAELPQDCA